MPRSDYHPRTTIHYAQNYVQRKAHTCPSHLTFVSNSPDRMIPVNEKMGNGHMSAANDDPLIGKYECHKYVPRDACGLCIH